MSIEQSPKSFSENIEEQKHQERQERLFRCENCGSVYSPGKITCSDCGFNLSKKDIVDIKKENQEETEKERGQKSETMTDEDLEQINQILNVVGDMQVYIEKAKEKVIAWEGQPYAGDPLSFIFTIKGVNDALVSLLENEKNVGRFADLFYAFDRTLRKFSWTDFKIISSEEYRELSTIMYQALARRMEEIGNTINGDNFFQDVTLFKIIGLFSQSFEINDKQRDIAKRLFSQKLPLFEKWLSDSQKAPHILEMYKQLMKETSSEGIHEMRDRAKRAIELHFFETDDWIKQQHLNAIYQQFLTSYLDTFTSYITKDDIALYIRLLFCEDKRADIAHDILQYVCKYSLSREVINNSLFEEFCGRYGLSSQTIRKYWEQWDLTVKSDEAERFLDETEKIEIQREAKKYFNSAAAYNLPVMHQLESIQLGILSFLYKRFDITQFGRYPENMLLEQYREYENIKKPYGIAIFPRADHNGACYFDRNELEKLRQGIGNAFTIRIVECESKQDIAKTLLRLNKQYDREQKISFAFIAGHGSPSGIMFGGNPRPVYEGEKLHPRFYIHKDDLMGHGVQRGKNFFIENPTLLLSSCSTGKEGGFAQELSQKFGATVIGPEMDIVGIDSLKVNFDKRGIPIFQVKYKPYLKEGEKRPENLEAVYERGEHKIEVEK